MQNSVIDEAVYVNLGLARADVYGALEKVLQGRRVDELDRSVLEAIKQLTT